ncbi:MAG TPA: HAMP domain-containing sensor histidine kinase [Acidimicrobiia bacterium]|nr:HAMP domain-containing sensor histidine kinase [Acidimicrobiia bacterium]
MTPSPGQPALKPPARRLGTRLFAAMLAIAFGVLVLSAAGTAALFRQTATDSALHDLRGKVPTVRDSVERLAAFRSLNPRAVDTAAERRLGRNLRSIIAKTLRAADVSVVQVTSTGQIQEGIAPLLGNAATQAGLTDLPAGLAPDDLDTKALLAGDEQSGREGRTAFVAAPLDIVNGNTPVVILTQQVETQPLGRAGPFFLLAGALALAVAGIVAFFLARRLTRPLTAMGHTADRIAGGDLSARVDLGKHPDDELAGLARALDGMAAQLEAARGLERGFLLSVSHDLRTPLTSIGGYAEAIADGAVEGRDAQKRAAGIIAAEARRLERLVADLLDLARLDAHEFSLTPRPVDAAEVVGEAAEAFYPSARDLGVALLVNGPATAPVDADPERLGQIVANLVENALKYARGQVTVGLSSVNGTLELRVDDDGPGIDTADLPHVFDRLYTSRTAPGRKVGTGLGLAIVHELSAAMGGTAAAHSLDGQGTRFVVKIPTGG